MQSVLLHILKQLVLFDISLENPNKSVINFYIFIMYSISETQLSNLGFGSQNQYFGRELF